MGLSVNKFSGLVSRFVSEEMKTARAMNKIATMQVKAPHVPRTYAQASAEDLKRLTSTTIEDSFSRVEWVNPKDGKVYNILKQGETKDGKVAVRILNENGGFVKEAELTPKVIGIPDTYIDSCEFGLSHGELVELFAKRNNPFARYFRFEVTDGTQCSEKKLDQVLDYIKTHGKLDYLSCSFGQSVAVQKKITPANHFMRQVLEEQSVLDKIKKSGTRVLCAADNASNVSEAKSLSNRLLVINQGAEGVGSLNPKTGKISDFSCSRNSSLTQHYEVGEFTPTLTPNGVNITGLSGTDIPFSSKRIDSLRENPLLNKSQKRVEQLKDAIDERIKELQLAKINLFKQKKPMPEILKEKRKLEEQSCIYSARRKKLFDYIGNLTVVDGKYQAPFNQFFGTSFATPARTAKLALNDMLEGIL